MFNCKGCGIAQLFMLQALFNTFFKLVVVYQRRLRTVSLYMAYRHQLLLQTLFNTFFKLVVASSSTGRLTVYYALLSGSHWSAESLSHKGSAESHHHNPDDHARAQWNAINSEFKWCAVPSSQLGRKVKGRNPGITAECNTCVESSTSAWLFCYL